MNTLKMHGHCRDFLGQNARGVIMKLSTLWEGGGGGGGWASHVPML